MESQIPKLVVGFPAQAFEARVLLLPQGELFEEVNWWPD